GLLATGVVSGAGLFAILSLSDEPALLFGGILGTMLGGLVLIAERQLQRLPPASIVPGAWVFLTCLAWGLAFGWAHDRLRSARSEGTDDAEATRRRRRFLATLAGATASLSAVSVIAAILANRLGRRAGGRRWSDDHPLPNADADVLPVAGT